MSFKIVEKNVSEHAKIYWKHVLECLWKSLKKVEKMLLESSRIWCTKIMTWIKYLKKRKKKLKSDQQQEQQTYVKDPEQECSRSKIIAKLCW